MAALFREQQVLSEEYVCFAGIDWWGDDPHSDDLSQNQLQRRDLRIYCNWTSVIYWYTTYPESSSHSQPPIMVQDRNYLNILYLRCTHIHLTSEHNNRMCKNLSPTQLLCFRLKSRCIDSSIRSHKPPPFSEEAQSSAALRVVSFSFSGRDGGEHLQKQTGSAVRGRLGWYTASREYCSSLPWEWIGLEGNREHSGESSA